MKKAALVLFLSVSLFVVSCSSDDDSSGSAGIQQSKIYGWWYPNANTTSVSYKAYYFGEDGSYIQDQSRFNLGNGLGTYKWTAANKITMTPTPGGGILGGVVEAEVFVLTNDTLVLGSQDLRLSRNNSED